MQPDDRRALKGEPVALNAAMQRLAAGDQAAAADLYDATSHLVFGLAVRILRERELAEDIVIEVYTQAWNLARTFDPERGTVAGWLLTLTRSRALDVLRSRRRDSAAETVDSIEEKQSERPNPEEVSLAAERHRSVTSALAHLNPDQREAIQLAYYSGLSHTQIAARLGQPLGTVKTRIRQGMIQLRELLEHLAPAAANQGM